VPRVFLEAVIEGIGTHVCSACAELVFNLDEIGVTEREDPIERKVVIPSGMREQKIFHGIHRRLKHISVKTSISVGSDHMIPFFVYSQMAGAVVRKLKTEGFRISIDIILKSETNRIPMKCDQRICINSSPSTHCKGAIKSRA
jgi:hypothetical protein